MTTLAPSSPIRQAIPRIPAKALGLVVLGLIVLLQLDLIFAKSINWDEFFHFSQIHQSLRGEQVQWLQTPYVHLFGWVPSLPGGPIDHIQTIRTMMLGFELVVLVIIYDLARHFGTRRAALVCTLAFATGGYAFLHAFALRADIIAAALAMSALWLGIRKPLTLPVLAGIAILLGLGCIATLKTVLYTPVFGAALYLRRGEIVRSGWSVVGFAGFVLVAIVGIVLFGGAAADSLSGLAKSSWERMFDGGLFPQARYLMRQLTIAPFFTVLVVMTVWWLIKSSASHERKIVLTLLMAPLLSVAVYRNAFPYFYAFILPPVAIALVPAAEIALKRYGKLAVFVALFTNALVLWWVEPRDILPTQRALQADVRTAFPAPVTYIDESGMIGDYPRAVPHFASGWALGNYWTKGHPEYAQATEKAAVPLLIANSHALANVFADQPVGDRLLPEDEALLRANFVPHGGMVFVAGKRIPARSVLSGEYLATPGSYRVEDAAVAIDGIRHEAGATVSLDRGNHRFENPSDTPATLRWAAAGEAKPGMLTLQQLFTDY